VTVNGNFEPSNINRYLTQTKTIENLIIIDKIMRVIKYMTDKNIGLKSINLMCDYLKLDPLAVNSNISESKISLLDATLYDESFKKWLSLKNELGKMEYDYAKKLIQNLYHSSTTEIDDILAERILMP